MIEPVPDLESAEIGRYHKKKTQSSKSKKRSDHKHEYTKSITMHVSPLDNTIVRYSWSTHCWICGRRGSSQLGGIPTEFLRPEYRDQKHLYLGHDDVLLPFAEIRRQYPDIPVYKTDQNNWKVDIRVR